MRKAINLAVFTSLILFQLQAQLTPSEIANAPDIWKWSIPTNDPALTIAPRERKILAGGNDDWGNDLTGKKIDPVTGTVVSPNFPSPGTRNAIWVSSSNTQDIFMGGYSGRKAYNADGTLFWSWDETGCCNGRPFAIHNDRQRAYLAQNNALYELNLSTGTVIPGFDMPVVDAWVGAYTTLNNNTAFITTSSGNVIIADIITHQVLEVQVDPGLRQVRPGAIASDGSVIVTSGFDHSNAVPTPGVLARVSSNGQHIWSQDINAVTVPVIGGNGLIYVGTQTSPVGYYGNGSIRAYAQNGNDLQLAWSTPILELPNDIIVADNGKIYVVAGPFAMGKLYELDQQTGAITKEIANLPGAWELILQSGVIYTSGMPAYNQTGSITAIPVNALEYDPTSPWPVRFHDNQRTSNQTSPFYEIDLTTINCPADIVASSNPGQCSVSLNPGTPTVQHNLHPLTVSGERNDALLLTDPYPVGVTTITWKAIDGNNVVVATCDQQITVEDHELPILTCPENLIVNNDAGQCGAIVSWNDPVLTDNCSIANGVSQAEGPIKGSYLAVGQYNVSYQGTDAAGNSTTCSFTITVMDTENPIITAPPAKTVNTDPGVCTASNLALGTPAYSDNCPGVTVTNNAPAVFPVGTNTVVWTATDAAGNIATANQTVTVIDNQYPIISLPPSLPVFCYNPTQTYTIPSVSVTDNCGISSMSFSVYLAVFYNSTSYTLQLIRTGTGINASGYFPPGRCFVYWTATDVNGKSSGSPSVAVFVDQVNATIPNAYANGVTSSIGSANTIYIGHGSGSITLSAQVSSSLNPTTYTYKWTIGTPAGPGFATTPSITVSPTTATTYFVSVKDANNCSQVGQLSKQVNVIDIRCGTGKIYICERKQNGSNTTKCVSTNNLTLSSGSYLGQCVSAARTITSTEAMPEPVKNIAAAGLSISVSPNPSQQAFNINITSDDQKEFVVLRVFNMWGQVIQAKDKIVTGQTITIGNNYTAGIYFAEASQGETRKVIKLIKQ